MSNHMGSETTFNSVVTHTFNSLLPLFVSKYFTGEHQLVYMSVITVVMTYAWMKINEIFQKTEIIRTVITCGCRRKKDNFAFTFSEIPSSPIIRYHSVIDNQEYAPEILWWILKNTKSNFGTTTLQIKTNIVDLFENGQISKTELRDRAILLVGGERNWIPLCKDNSGTFAFYKMWGNGDDFHIAIGSETYKCYEYVWGRIVQEGVTSKRTTTKNPASAMAIYKIAPNNHELIGTASKKRTFDSLFFEEKDRLIRILTAFKDKTMYPSHIGSDNKLGILLHGPPGTGKTHAVVATANFLGRSIASISMRDVKTCNDFDKVLDYPRNGTVFVLEEIDCVLGVLRKRMATPSVPPADTEDDEEYNTLFQVYINTEDKEQKAQILDELQSIKKKKNNRLTLGYILEKLDGITDESDRIIIATTNYPELLDEALLRPGRLGFHLNLGLCTKKMIIDILVHYYGLDATRRAELETVNFQTNKYSPAQIIQHIQMDTGIDSVIEFIKTQQITEEVVVSAEPVEAPISTFTTEQVQEIINKRREKKHTTDLPKEPQKPLPRPNTSNHQQYHYSNIENCIDSETSDDETCSDDNEYEDEARHYLTESLLRYRLERRMEHSEELDDIVKNEEARLVRTALTPPFHFGTSHA